MIDVQDVIAGLRQKAAQLAQAVLVLEELDGTHASAPVEKPQITAELLTPRKRKVSASTRARMKAAQQARWRKAKLKIVAKKGA